MTATPRVHAEPELTAPVALCGADGHLNRPAVIKCATNRMLVVAALAATIALFAGSELSVSAQDPLTQTPGPIPMATASPAADAATPQTSAAVGSLIVTPKSGPIGTVVTIRGSGFPRSAYVYFFCLLPPLTSGGPVRQAGFATVNMDAGVSFEFSWPIPSALEPQQGMGGGATPQADCQFALKPPSSAAPFTVTAGVAALPGTGGGSAHDAVYRMAIFCSLAAGTAFLLAGLQARKRKTGPFRMPPALRKPRL
jgi:hypothetical protein